MITWHSIVSSHPINTKYAYKLANQKLLVSISQSFSGYLIYFYYYFFDRAKEANVYEIKTQRLRSQKVIIVEEELEGIDIDGIGNLEDLLKVVFIDKAFGNLKINIDDGELTRNINRKTKSDLFQAFWCPLCDKCCRQEHFFNK